VTWKQNGLRHDSKNNRVRPSKGATHKEHPKAWEYILAEYETRPGVTIENLQQVRAVYDQQQERWELHLVCKDEIETPTAPGNETAGIDFGISNFAAVAYSTEDADLYPGNRLKQDGYYFPSARTLARELNVGVLGVEKDGDVDPLELPQVVGTPPTPEHSAIAFQASAQGVADRSFGLNHPKNYLAFPLAVYHPEETATILADRVVAATDDACRGAAFLNLIDERPAQVRLTPSVARCSGSRPTAMGP
jgi:hypothetical protein